LEVAIKIELDPQFITWHQPTVPFALFLSTALSGHISR
jgi:hypothetical protein